MAVVVSLPSRTQEMKRVAPTAANAAGMARLREAIRQLGINLDRQLEEIAKFRQEIANLDETFVKLQASFVRFDREVARIDLRPLQRKSRRLAVIMDDYLHSAGKKP